MSQSNKKKPLSKMSFEESFEELENLVEKFEEGQLPLDEWIERLERAMQLYEKCSNQLAEAEKKVQKILEKVTPIDDTTKNNLMSGEDEN